MGRAGGRAFYGGECLASFMCEVFTLYTSMTGMRGPPWLWSLYPLSLAFSLPPLPSSLLSSLFPPTSPLISSCFLSLLPPAHTQWIALFAGILVMGAALGVVFGVVMPGGKGTSSSSITGDDKSIPILDGVKENVPEPPIVSPTVNSTSSSAVPTPVVTEPVVVPPTINNNLPQQGSGMLGLIDKTANAAAAGQAPLLSSPLLNGIGNGLMGTSSAALPDMFELANAQNSGKLNRLAESLAEQAQQSEQFEQAKTQFSNIVTRASTGACRPADGWALRDAIAAKCMYIRLAPGGNYVLTTTSLNITYPVAIVGDVWDRPTLDGRKTPRLFNVMAGGFLDLQFVRVYRGVARSFLNKNLAVVIGGAALVYFGAGSNFLGVIFTAPRETWFARDIKGAVLFGGQILNLGGLVTLTDCHFFSLSPTAIRVATVVGGDVLTVIGVTVASGCTHTQIAVAVAGVGVAGLFQTVLGGVGIFSGCVFNRNIGLQFGAMAGIQTHVGAGVGIFTGCIFNTQGGGFSAFGVAIKQFLGAGVLINTGVIQNKNFGANIFCGAGPFIAVGAGINHNNGCIFNLNSGAGFLATSGGQHFLGAGHMSCVGCLFARTFGTVSAYGLGATTCTDAGDVELIACPSAVIAGSAATAMLSLQYFMAAGHTLILRSPSIRLVAVYLRVGQGIAAYVGAGNLTVINTRDAFRGLLGYAATLSGKRQVKYFCQGRGYQEVKKVPTLLKPDRFPAYTPQPKRRNLALEGGAGTKGQETAAVVTVRNALFDDSIAAFPATSNACFENVESSDIKGGSLPAPGALAAAFLRKGKKGEEGEDVDISAIFAGAGGDQGTADCSHPLFAASQPMDECSIFNSTLTGCEAGQGYLGLEQQEADTCKTGEGHCPLPLDVVKSAVSSTSSRLSSLFSKHDRHVRALGGGDDSTATTGGKMHITRADVMVTCQDAAPACRNSKALREAFGEYLNLGSGAKVAVSLEAGLPPIIAGHLGIFDEEEDSSGSGEEECGALTQFHVFVTTKESALADHAKAAFRDFNKQETNAAFTAALATVPGFESVCAIAAVVAFDYSLPLLDSSADAMVGDTTANAITPAVAVLDGDTALRSLSTIYPGETVGIKLSKFSSDSLAVVSMQDSRGKVVEVVSFTPSSASQVISWRVPADVVPGFYVFKASPASNPAIVATSPIIKVGRV